MASSSGYRLEHALRAVREAPEGPGIGAFFDLDGTLVRGFTAFAFLRDSISRGELSMGQALALAGSGLSFLRRADGGSEVIRAGVRAMAGRTLDDLEARAAQIFQRRVARTIRSGARQLVQAHQDRGHTVAIASSATPFQVAPVARDLSIDHLLTTRIEVLEGRVTGELDGASLWGLEKARSVEAFAAENDIDRAQSFAYGNGREDHRFLSSVGHPTAVRPDRGLTAIARAEGIPILQLEDPPRGGLVGTLRTALAAGVVTAGLAATLAASPILGRKSAFRRGLPWTADLALAAAGIRVRASGLPHIEAAKPAVFVFNHQSNLDPVVVASLVRGNLTAVGKKEVMKGPAGLVVRFLDLALIDRGNSEEARASVAALVERIHSGESVLMAPEGTRMPTPTLGRFKRGAFHLALDARVPVVPIVLRNTGELLPRSSASVASGVVDAHVLPPIPTVDWTRDDVGLEADRLRDRYAQVLRNWPG